MLTRGPGRRVCVLTRVLARKVKSATANSAHDDDADQGAPDAEGGDAAGGDDDVLV